MTMNPRTRRRQAVAARVVAMATLAMILFMPKIELDAFDGPAAMSFATAEPHAVD
jgi:hypothetical protein